MRFAPERAGRGNALHTRRNLEQDLQRAHAQVWRRVYLCCEVNRVRHAKYFAMSGLSRNGTEECCVCFCPRSRGGVDASAPGAKRLRLLRREGGERCDRLENGIVPRGLDVPFHVGSDCQYHVDTSPFL